MISSPFLTAIAKDYNPRIESVSFGDLSLLKSSPLGIAWQHAPGSYIIQIDKARLVCAYQVLYVFYHELGHILAGHVHYQRALGGADVYREIEADAFAFREMRLIDSRGHVNEETRLCYSCFCSKSKVCLKKTPRGV
jgi:hypothetical protein